MMVEINTSGHVVSNVPTQLIDIFPTVLELGDISKELWLNFSMDTPLSLLPAESSSSERLCGLTIPW